MDPTSEVLTPLWDVPGLRGLGEGGGPDLWDVSRDVL